MQTVALLARHIRQQSQAHPLCRLKLGLAPESDLSDGASPQPTRPDRRDVEGWYRFYGLQSVAVAPDGSVYVADTGNNRILKFSVEP